MNDRLNFILTVIKRDYNTNDSLNFILSFIRRHNGLNDQSKLIKNRRKWYRYEEESKQSKNGPLRVHRMNWKIWNKKLTGWSSTNDEERQRMSTELITEMSRKHYGSVSAWIFSFFLLLLTNFKWFLRSKGVGLFPQPPTPPFIAKMGRSLLPSSPKRAGCFLTKFPERTP